jgi:hypothetical protein
VGNIGECTGSGRKVMGNKQKIGRKWERDAMAGNTRRMRTMKKKNHIVSTKEKP